MTREKRGKAWLAGAAGAALFLSAGGAAQAQSDDAPIARNQPQTADAIVVRGQIAYRNRVAGAAPVLDYGLDYFQRFEPLTVGDMLKRTPSTAFVSDVLEFDGVRLRGLDPGYTQILINGERTPGSDVDRSFWVDRIPAELVERIEIIRAPSANRSGDALAGALNIVLRDAYALDGGFLRAGGLHFNDGEWKPTLGGVYGGAFGQGGRFLLGANLQGRYNPKEKLSDRYDQPPAIPGNFDNREYQSDVRDGTDYSFNGSLFLPIGAGELEFSGFYVRTDRTERELSREFSDPSSQANDVLLAVTPQLEDLIEDNFALRAQLTQPMFGGETKFRLGYARFQDDIVATETEFVYEDGDNEFESVRELTDLVDEDWSASFSYARALGGDVRIQFGLDYSDKQRDTTLLESELEGDIPDPVSPPLGDLNDSLGSFVDFDPITGGLSVIEERRLDPYLMFSGGSGMFDWEIGLRYETTDATIKDLDAGVSYSNDYAFLLPSAHLRVNLTERDRISLSGGRTVRRPNFDFLVPALLEEEPTEEHDLRGNPLLDPETAWGFDIGYERRIGRSGVAGVNFFYRSVDDLIELTSTGLVSSSGEGFILEPRNVGDGSVWGVELDFSAPLTIFGLDDTGVFLNYSWLDSEITDPVTGDTRRFNNQAKSVLNIGFIQDLPSWGAAFGASYREQGDAFARIAGETVATSYGADLEVFVEKRFGDRFTLRFIGSNLLDASKDETFFKWDTIADQLSGDPDDLDEYEIETESSGPVFQIVGRLAF